MKYVWASPTGQPMYLMMRRWESHGLDSVYAVALQLEKSTHQTAIFMLRWRIIPQ